MAKLVDVVFLMKSKLIEHAKERVIERGATWDEIQTALSAGNEAQAKMKASWSFPRIFSRQIGCP